MSTYGHGDAPHDVEVAETEICWSCDVALVSPLDIFGNHCGECVVRMRADVEGDFGAGGPAQLLLARHRAFDDWLGRNRR